MRPFLVGLSLLLVACEKKAPPAPNGDPLATAGEPTTPAKSAAPLPDQAELDQVAGDAGKPTSGNDNARTAILAKTRGAMKKCWVSAIEKEKATSAEFTLKVVVDDAGKVTSAEAVDLVGSKVMAECVASAVKALTLAPNAAGTTTIPLRFNAK